METKYGVSPYLVHIREYKVNIGCSSKVGGRGAFIAKYWNLLEVRLFLKAFANVSLVPLSNDCFSFTIHMEQLLIFE